MAQDVFQRNVSNLAGVFTADHGKLIFRGNLGVLVQNFGMNYVQTVSRLYEVGSNGPGGAANIYYVGGRTQGGLSLAQVLGPTLTVEALYTTYGDVCNARQNIIDLILTETDCSEGTSGPRHYTARNCVMTQLAISVGAQDMIIAQNSSMMFSSLELASA